MIKFKLFLTFSGISILILMPTINSKADDEMERNSRGNRSSSSQQKRQQAIYQSRSQREDPSPPTCTRCRSKPAPSATLAPMAPALRPPSVRTAAKAPCRSCSSESQPCPVSAAEPASVAIPNLSHALSKIADKEKENEASYRAPTLASDASLSGFRLANKLSINTNPSHYRTEVSTLEDAELQLMQLAKTAEKEEGWVYLPDKKTFLEVGKNETPDRNDIDFEALKPVFGTDTGTLAIGNRLLNTIPSSAVDYHIHPSVNADTNIRAIPRDLDPTQRPLAETYNRLQPSFPSSADLQNLYTTGFRKAKVISEDGVYELSFAERPLSPEQTLSNANQIGNTYSQISAGIIFDKTVNQKMPMDQARQAAIDELNQQLKPFVTLRFYKPQRGH